MAVHGEREMLYPQALHGRPLRGSARASICGREEIDGVAKRTEAQEKAAGAGIFLKHVETEPLRVEPLGTLDVPHNDQSVGQSSELDHRFASSMERLRLN